MAGEPELTVISLGGGVQSSVLALMAAEGAVKPMPDYAIFADTGWEPEGVYRHMDWLEGQLPFPVRRVSQSNIRADILAGVNSTGQPFNSVPFYVRSPSGKTGIAKRQCTREYKLAPIHEDLKYLLGLGYRQRIPENLFAELWIGISTDEAHFRMKDSRDAWIEHRWPLVEQGMTREDCREWFAERFGTRTLPRSACIGCPYHTDAEWATMKEEDPDSWADAIFIDDALRRSTRAMRFDGEMYLHRSRLPLAQATFDGNGQARTRSHAANLASLEIPPNGQPSLFEECEGLCGV